MPALNSIQALGPEIILIGENFKELLHFDPRTKSRTAWLLSAEKNKAEKLREEERLIHV